MAQGGRQPHPRCSTSVQVLEDSSSPGTPGGTGARSLSQEERARGTSGSRSNEPSARDPATEQSTSGTLPGVSVGSAPAATFHYEDRGVVAGQSAREVARLAISASLIGAGCVCMCAGRAPRSALCRPSQCMGLDTAGRAGPDWRLPIQGARASTCLCGPSPRPRGGVRVARVCLGRAPRSGERRPR